MTKPIAQGPVNLMLWRYPQATCAAVQTAHAGTRSNTFTANAVGRGEAIFSATRTAHSEQGKCPLTNTLPDTKTKGLRDCADWC